MFRCADRNQKHKWNLVDLIYCYFYNNGICLYATRPVILHLVFFWILIFGIVGSFADHGSLYVGIFWHTSPVKSLMLNVEDSELSLLHVLLCCDCLKRYKKYK
ncbi:hypothetical protein GDO86_010111 [Hymenochirus boettgeri]|uniref:Uncharacterized protein n=1 Tax=Hymenochirus boettgeri TaxID=247094 RepID=A0A8T2JN64_9PIPI|nr:hypothetical protein GDO86_010111 [Hymenochirus boettgeri]